MSRTLTCDPNCCANSCGESDDGFTCQNSITYERAESACANFGARLCTADELMGGEAEGTGCGHDFRYVWSSSTRVQVPAALAPDSNNGNIVCPDGQKVVVLGNQGPGGGGSLTVEGRTFPNVAHCQPVCHVHDYLHYSPSFLYLRWLLAAGSLCDMIVTHMTQCLGGTGRSSRRRSAIVALLRRHGLLGVRFGPLKHGSRRTCRIKPC